MNKTRIGDAVDRVDGRLKVTGAATYSGEYKLPGLCYGVLVPATIASGAISTIDTRAAMKSPGVVGIVTAFNAIKLPGYESNAENPVKGLKLFDDKRIYFHAQPIALVIADSFERATYAASLVKATYAESPAQTDFHEALKNAQVPKDANQKDYQRGDADAVRGAEVVVEADYLLPSEMHNPMELHVTTAWWENPESLHVYTKSQGVYPSQKSIAAAFGLKPEQVQVHSRFVGGAFGSSLRTWPHEMAAIQAAKMFNKPIRVTLTREQMFTQVGYRPQTLQHLRIGANRDGRLSSITHESFGQTAVYEEFTERSANVSRFMYACPNVTTRYRLVPLNIGVPAPMRGPGEATGVYALESALDELSHKLGIDPVELRLRNEPEHDPELSLPWSSRYMRECYTQGAERIGWKNRKTAPGTNRDGDWLIGYGMGCGSFRAFRSKTKAKIRLNSDGSVNIKSAASDIGPGTATAMVIIASDTLGMPADKISFELGDTALPQAPMQGGSATVSSVGTAVREACLMLRGRLNELEGRPRDSDRELDYAKLLRKHNLNELEFLAETEGQPKEAKYSMYSFSAHFAKVAVHRLTGVLRVRELVAVVDAGTIVNHKTASSQMIGGAVGGIGMALTEEAVMDHRYSRYVNGNFADYHVPVNADIPDIQAIFIGKPDPHTNPIGSKGIGEISLIGVAPAIANAVFNATGKRIREMPITPDKLLV
jgi:xanthine dehydrogenase YagR molybdenum-binding subunit